MDSSSLVHLIAVQAAEPIKGCGFVALGEGWVVEDGVDEVLDCAAEDHDCLANVDLLAGAFADDVDAENFARFSLEDELEAPGSVPADLASGSFAIESHANFVGDVLVSELLFSFADETDFGDGVNAVGIETGVGRSKSVVECAGGGD